MAKARFTPMIEWLRGRVGRLVFRLSHNGEVSVYESPDMSRVKWSRAQKDHRLRMGEASKYAAAAIADPEIRPVYVQMAIEQGGNPKRPFDTAVSDYYHTGNDLLWKKHMGDRPKPDHWDIDRYPWYVKPPGKRRRKRST